MFCFVVGVGNVVVVYWCFFSYLVYVCYESIFNMLNLGFDCW